MKKRANWAIVILGSILAAAALFIAPAMAGAAGYSLYWIGGDQAPVSTDPMDPLNWVEVAEFAGPPLTYSSSNSMNRVPDGATSCSMNFLRGPGRLQSTATQTVILSADQTCYHVARVGYLDGSPYQSDQSSPGTVIITSTNGSKLTLYGGGSIRNYLGATGLLRIDVPVFTDVSTANIQVSAGRNTITEFNSSLCDGQTGKWMLRNGEVLSPGEAFGKIVFNADSSTHTAQLDFYQDIEVVVNSLYALGKGRINMIDTVGHQTVLSLASDLYIVNSAVSYFSGLSDPGSGEFVIANAGGDVDRTFTYEVGSTANTRLSLNIGGTNRGGTGKVHLKFSSINTTSLHRGDYTIAAGCSVEFDTVGSSAVAKLDGYNVGTYLPANTYGDGYLVKWGLGTLTVASTLGHTGGTLIHAGTVQIITSTLKGSLPTTGTIAIDAGAGLDLNGIQDQTIGGLAGNGAVSFGTGLVSRTLTVNEGIRPGASAGTLTFTGTGIVSLAASANSVFEIGALTSTNDSVIMTGAKPTNLVLGGTLTIRNLGGIEVGSYRLFDLNTGTASGSFGGGLVLPGIDATVGLSGNDVMLNVTHLYLPGDANCDGSVDATDYALWFNNYGTVGYWRQANFHEDTSTYIDASSYADWFNNYGAGSSVASVPEPITMVLLAVGGLVCLRRRSRS